jgi:hypothetical protein
MIECLDGACTASADPPDAPPIQTASLNSTGKRGRRRIELDRELLEVGLELRGPTGLAPVFGCDPRTVRRRALEYGLVEPGRPVYIEYEQEGHTIRIYNPFTASTTDLPDNELDAIVSYILETFPNFGRRMIDGHLRHLGHHVPRSRIETSFSRVHGAPRSAFGARRIERRVYSVPGPNSLAHHDGQHGIFHLGFSSNILTIS